MLASAQALANHLRRGFAAVRVYGPQLLRRRQGFGPAGAGDWAWRGRPWPVGRLLLRVGTVPLACWRLLTRLLSLGKWEISQKQISELCISVGATSWWQKQLGGPRPQRALSWAGGARCSPGEGWQGTHSPELCSSEQASHLALSIWRWPPAPTARMLSGEGGPLCPQSWPETTYESSQLWSPGAVSFQFTGSLGALWVNTSKQAGAVPGGFLKALPPGCANTPLWAPEPHSS